MYSTRHIATVLLASLVLTVRPYAVSGQEARERIAAWSISQTELLSAIKSADLVESARTSLDAGAGARNYSVQSTRTITPVDAGAAHTVLFVSERSITRFRANGQEVNAQRADRFLEQQQRTFRPELASLLESFEFPGAGMLDFQNIDEPVQVERNGQVFWRIRGQIELPSPVGPPNGGQRGRRPWGAPDELGTPPSDGSELGAPPRGRGGPNRPRPRASFTAWFTLDEVRIHASRIEMPLPSRFSLSISTTYSSISGIDVPSNRIIEGTIPIRRRNRTYSVYFNQVLNYSDYAIKLN